MGNLQENIMSTKKKTITLTVKEAERILNILVIIANTPWIHKSFAHKLYRLAYKINDKLKEVEDDKK